MVLNPGSEATARRIFEKWELDFAVIGRITDTGKLVLRMKGETVAEMPVGPLVTQAPLYDRPWVETPPPREVSLGEVSTKASLLEVLQKLLGCPDLCSKRWIWEQYDHLVMGRTVQRPGGDAAVVRLPGSRKALALVTDCTQRYCATDPPRGAARQGDAAAVGSHRSKTAVARGAALRQTDSLYGTRSARLVRRRLGR